MPTWTPSSPVGLHRVLDPAGAGALPQAARRLDDRAELWHGRGADRRRHAQPRRGVVPAAGEKHTPTGRRRRGRARGGPRHRRHPRQDAEPGHRLRRDAHRHGRRGRSGQPARADRRRPGRDPRLAVPHPAAPRPTASRAGTAAASRSRPRATPSSSAAASPPCCPRTCPPALALMVMDVCGAPALVARVVGEYAARGHAARPCSSSVGRGSPGRSRWRPRGKPAPAALSPSSPPSARRRCCERTGLADEVVVADARSPARPVARPSLQPAGRPTSPSSASTCPGASSRRSCPPPRAAPSSSSRWRPASPPPRSGPRASRPTCGCSSATATSPGTPAYALDLLRCNAGRACPLRVPPGD